MVWLRCSHEWRKDHMPTVLLSMHTTISTMHKPLQRSVCKNNNNGSIQPPTSLNHADNNFLIIPFNQ